MSDIEKMLDNPPAWFDRDWHGGYYEKDPENRKKKWKLYQVSKLLEGSVKNEYGDTPQDATIEKLIDVLAVLIAERLSKCSA